MLSADRATAVFLNGVEVARDTDLGGSTSLNHPGATLKSTGGVSDVQKFERTVPFFAGLKAGVNEIVVAVDNPAGRTDGRHGPDHRLVRYR